VRAEVTKKSTIHFFVTKDASRTSVLVEPRISTKNRKGTAMQSSATAKWPMLAASGLLLAAATLAVCQTTSLCDLNVRSHAETNASTSPGETNMSVAQKNSQVHHANEANFAQIVLNSNVPVLVDFYADWCGPCQRLAPILENLAAETPNARIVKVNVDQNPNLAAQYGISAIPSLMVFQNGAVVDQVAGLASKNQLRSMLDR
jgi:thioredoxin 1